MKKLAANVLLIDDEEMIVDVGKQLLEHLGYSVLTAGSGQEAIQILSDNHKKIDLVILDLIMPGIGGGKCWKQLLEIDPKAKIVISSGYSDYGPMRGSLESAAVGFISKPYDIETLLQGVRKALDTQT